MSTRAEAYDVAVAGAGASGLLAALTAARLGARVALVEARDRVGGVAVFGLHRFVCGLFACGGERPGGCLQGDEVARFCRQLAGGLEEKAVRRGRVWLLPFGGGGAFSACASDLLARASGVTLVLRDRPASVVCDAGRICALRLVSGRVLEAGAVIDCTGAAAVCRLAGAAVVCPESPALGGYGFELEGVEEETGGFGLAVEVPLALRREADAGRLPRRFAFTTVEPSEVPGRIWVKLAVPNDAGAGARADADAAFAVLRRLPAWARARMTAVTPEVLPREGCRLRGRYRLTTEDVLEARRFEDGVARDAWPVEYWDAQDGVRYRYPPAGTGCDIPLRCLMPERGPANLMCAGAAISADAGAAASARVMGVCMALGEAAARAALEGSFFRE